MTAATGVPRGPRPAAQAEQPPKLAYIPALDGVRAVAIGLVFAYHLDVGVLPGGFLGVDLFFVLSGFLITSLLLAEFRRSGGIDLVAFWLRRARRLLPALFLLVAVIAIWALGVSRFERDQLRWDVLSALGYVANWRFIATGQSYFSEFTQPSPVRHLWSLAIEEQFYVVWPLLASVGLLVASRRRWGRMVVMGVLVAATIGSLTVLAATYDEWDPSGAYFSTISRAHELLIGALGAVLVAAPSRVPWVLRRHGASLAAVSVPVVLGFAVALHDTSSAYYYGGSLLFAVAALALVVGLVVAGDRGPVGRALSLAPVRYVGAISYGLYLWHWPLITWLTPDTIGVDGPLLAFLRVAATLLVASASYLVVERPIRRGRIGGWRLGPRPVAGGAVLALVVLASTTVLTTRGALPAPQFLENNRELIVSDVRRASGSLGMIGDSIAMSLYPGMAVESAARSRVLAAAVYPGCPVGTAVRVDGSGAQFSFARKCPQAAVSGQRTMATRYHPSVVFWLSARERWPIREGNVVLAPGSAGWERAAFADWDAVLARIAPHSTLVALVLPFHRPGDDPSVCQGAGALSTDACTRPNLDINALRTEYRRWAAVHPDEVIVLDPDPILCPTGPCPAALGRTPIFSDRVHLTRDAALIVARRLVEMLPTGVVAPGPSPPPASP